MKFAPVFMINKNPTHEMNVNNVLVQTFYVNKGEGLDAQEHDYTHVTQCHAGKICVRKSYTEVFMDKYTPAIMIKGDEWHQIEAIEDDTIFISVYSLIDPVDQKRQQEKL